VPSGSMVEGVSAMPELKIYSRKFSSGDNFRLFRFAIHELGATV